MIFEISRIQYFKFNIEVRRSESSSSMIEEVVTESVANFGS